MAIQYVPVPQDNYDANHNNRPMDGFGTGRPSDEAIQSTQDEGVAEDVYSQRFLRAAVHPAERQEQLELQFNGPEPQEDPPTHPAPIEEPARGGAADEALRALLETNARLLERLENPRIPEMPEVVESVEMKRARHQELLQAYNFNPEDPAHQLLVQLLEDKDSEGKRVAKLEEELKQRELDSMQSKYVTTLERTLERELRVAGLELTDEDASELREQALALAAMKRMEDPTQAVKQVLAPLARLAKVHATTPRVSQAVRAAAVSTTSGLQQKGQTASGRQRPAATREELFDRMFPGSKRGWR